MKQVVCLSTTPWHAHPTRKQQVMSRMPDCEILYFDPPITYLAPLKDSSLKPRLSEHRRQGEQVAKNIMRFSLPPILPFYNKSMTLNRLNGQLITARYVKNIMQSCGFDSPVMWLYHPSMIDAVRHIPHSALVYDCVDRHSAYPGHISVPVVDGMERRLAKRANVVFATASGLYDTLRPSNKNTYLIPNGANFELFNTASAPLPCPDDMVDIKRPILGFVGAIQHCTDTDLIANAAAKCPDLSFVLVGNPLAGVSIDALRALPNVFMLGPKPNSDVPRYIANLDVCLNLFRSGDLSRDVSPLKFMEYLATGKPIVSTPHPLQVLDFSDSIYIAKSTDEFIATCRNALSEKDDSLKSRRIEYGRACSWDRRVQTMREILCKHNILT